MRWDASRRRSGRCCERHHDESIALVVAEPLASMVASYLRCEPRVQLDERWSCGGFELIEIAPVLLAKRDGLTTTRARSTTRVRVAARPQPAQAGSRRAHQGAISCQRGTDDRQTPGTSTPKASECRKASGCAARGARRPSFANKSSKTWASARSATTTSFFRPRERIAQLLDLDTFEEWFSGLQPLDPLGFNDRRPYPERVKGEQARTGLEEAAVVGQGFIKGIRIVLGLTDSGFIMGSMGSVVGEKLTRAIEEATRQQLPLVIVSGSGGGARMHEGIFSLMQMAKVSTALGRFHAAGGLYISVLTHPTMGGVAASFASLGDLILAEPKALIGFAGPRVIEQTVRVQLPSGFQTSEFLCEHGFIDRIVHRRDLRSTIAQIIDYLERPGQPHQLKQQIVLQDKDDHDTGEMPPLARPQSRHPQPHPISPALPGIRRSRAARISQLR